MHHSQPRSNREKRATLGSFRGRRNRRGAAVFVVMMAIILLTGVGMWAVHLAGLTDAASGYARAAAQAQYTGELGIVAGSGYLSIPGFADANYAVAVATPDDCWSVSQTATPGEFCKAMPMTDIDTAIAAETLNFGSVSYNLMDLGAAQGSLGPVAGVLDGNFILEMSEPRPAVVEGMDVGQLKYQTVTLTSYGIVRPQNGAFCTGAQGENAVATQVGMRARMILGPLTSVPQ
jgi:hypothetical protein